MKLMDVLATSRRRFTTRLTARLFVRFHMSVIFAGTAGAGIVASRLLLAVGVDSLMARYALTVVASYAVFFVLVRVWIAYVTRIVPNDPGLDLPDVSGSGGTGGEFEPGGGQFGGGGASGSYDDAGEVPVFRSVAEAGGRGGDSTGSGSGGGSDGLSFDVDDGIVLVIALLLLVSLLGGAAVWLVWQAPVILPEAAFEALLASGLIKAARRGDTRGWARGVLKSTLIPFMLVLAAASFAGWAAQRACPEATRLTDVVHRCLGGREVSETR
jgi:hypothetical protein